MGASNALQTRMSMVYFMDIQHHAKGFARQQGTTDYLFNPDSDIPQEVSIGDKHSKEQLKLISELDEDDRQIIFKMIDTMLTKKKFKTFFKENIER